jgi:hypothetical protein
MSFSVALRGHTSRLVRAGLKGRCRGTNIPDAWALEPPRAPGRLHGRLNVGATIVTTDAAYMLVTRKRAQGPARIAPSSSSGQQTELRRLTRRRPWALLQPPGSSALPPSEVAAPGKAPSRGVRCLPGSRSGSQGAGAQDASACRRSVPVPSRPDPSAPSPGHLSTRWERLNQGAGAGTNVSAPSVRAGARGLRPDPHGARPDPHGTPRIPDSHNRLVWRSSAQRG